MTAGKRGYYCLVQYCPDPGRLEAANLGVLLFSPEASFLDVRLSASNDRVRRFFGRSFDNWALNSAKQALSARLRADRDGFKTVEDLEQFVRTRANDLIVTMPRPVKVVEPERDLERLFDELVGRVVRPQRRGPVVPELDQVFHRLQREGRALLDLPVRVPLLSKRMKIPYAYRNGAVNLVKPERFAQAEGTAKDAAIKLAVEGDLIQRYGEDEEGKKKLVVVSSFASPSPELQEGIARILKEYHVRAILPSELPAFVREVEEQAH